MKFDTFSNLRILFNKIKTNLNIKNCLRKKNWANIQFQQSKLGKIHVNEKFEQNHFIKYSLTFSSFSSVCTIILKYSI